MRSRPREGSAKGRHVRMRSQADPEVDPLAIGSVVARRGASESPVACAILSRYAHRSRTSHENQLPPPCRLQLGIEALTEQTEDRIRVAKPRFVRCSLSVDHRRQRIEPAPPATDNRQVATRVNDLQESGVPGLDGHEAPTRPQYALNLTKRHIQICRDVRQMV